MGIQATILINSHRDLLYDWLTYYGGRFVPLETEFELLY